MKTAVSLPDDLFLEAEAAAQRLQLSRSQLYSTAIAEFLENRRNESITERLNEIYTGQPAKVDEALQSAQLKTLKPESW